LSGSSPPPALLGTFNVQTGVYGEPASLSIPVTSADLEFRTTVVPGSAVSPNEVSFQVVNHGPGAAASINVSLDVLTNQYQGVSGTYTWHPDVGTVGLPAVSTEPGRYNWQIPAIAVGQTVTVEGSLLPKGAAYFSAAVDRWQSVDFNPDNNQFTQVPLSTAE
jgi:hypothetical protein